MRSVAGGIDGIEPVFDDCSLVADAGLLVAGTVMSRLGLEALIDDVVRPPRAGRGAGRKVLSLVASMMVGGRCIDDTDRLRSGSAAAVLPFEVVAPSTQGTFLRSFTWGHVRQLDRAAEAALGQAWSVGAAPAVVEMTLDLDSTICEVCGKAKHGTCYGHTKVLGSRMRSGSSYQVTFLPTGWCAPPTGHRPTDRLQGTKPAKSRVRPAPVGNATSIMSAESR